MRALTETDDVSVQLIATTHSPLVLASIEPDFDDQKDVVWELDLVNEQVKLQQFPWRRMGDVNNWLTSEAFDLKEPMSIEAEEAVTKALSLFKAPAPTEQQIGEVDQLLRQSLGDVDRFWMSWSEFRKRRRVRK